MMIWIYRLVIVVKKLEGAVRVIMESDLLMRMLGVNIGGAGTLIASLASLITFREYCAHNPGKAGSYLAKFTALNFGFAGVLTLLHLMAKVEDTNLYHRGGEAGAAWAKAEAEKLLPCADRERVEVLDDAFIARRLSPGGCADLLAVCWMLYFLKTET